jgi:hypothetical protein
MFSIDSATIGHLSWLARYQLSSSLSQDRTKIIEEKKEDMHTCSVLSFKKAMVTEVSESVCWTKVFSRLSSYYAVSNSTPP